MPDRYKGKRYQRLSILFLCFGLLYYHTSLCQSFVFARLQGAPVNTGGWTMSGAARVGNIKNSDSSEVILCTTITGQTGGIFYSTPINLAKCNQWKAEFDFRIYDGTSADGLAFCFLDVPPSNFVSGEGIGIPATSNGLKVVFDTYNNCTADPTSAVPKLELRWGTGYQECSSLPTLDNSSGKLSFIRSDSYNHAVITYNAGNISVSVNDQTYLTGFQLISLQGYLGFTSGTGGNYDNHSIKNVTIYTNVPSFEAGEDKSICAGQTVQIGSPANELYHYQWSPAEGLNSATAAQPVVNIPNPTDSDITRKYIVTTSLSDSSGCTATDSITIRVKTLSPPSVSIQSPATRFCEGSAPPLFTATATAGGTSSQYQWMINGEAGGTNSDTFSTPGLQNGDIITCRLTDEESCAAETTAVSNSISLPVYPSPAVDAGAPVSIGWGGSTPLMATVSGSISRLVWSPATGLSNSGVANPIANPRQTTTYTVTVQSENDCSASDTVTVKVLSKDVVVPSAFTPNEDGKNDLFKPLVLGNTLDYRFAVYNRWGQTLFQSGTAGVGWDGTIKGNKQPAGAYIWRVTCTLDNGEHIVKQGTVLLVR